MILPPKLCFLMAGLWAHSRISSAFVCMDAKLAVPSYRQSNDRQDTWFKIVVVLDLAPCTLIRTTLSEEIAVSILRVEVTTFRTKVLTLRMHGATPPLPVTSSWYSV